MKKKKKKKIFFISIIKFRKYQKKKIIDNKINLNIKK